jgi:sorting and assembly machinery component 37
LGVTTVFAISLASLAVHHRRSPREGELIFWALRPSSGLGEAGSILSVFANQLHDGALYSQI